MTISNAPMIIPLRCKGGSGSMMRKLSGACQIFARVGFSSNRPGMALLLLRVFLSCPEKCSLLTA
ncbi:Uncharacterised protein [Enterobacter cloacae]|nr:Uncharacterised protein [Enterobacter cloacae]